MARDCLLFRMDRDGRIEFGTLVLVAVNCNAQQGHQLNTPKIQALEVNIATGSSRISVVDVHRSPGSTPAKDR